MKRRLTTPALLATLLLTGCSTLDAINPFASSGGKKTPLPALTGESTVRERWSADVGKALDYHFAPAIVGDVVYAADQKGMLYRIEGGKVVWKTDAGQRLTSGVAANGWMLVVGTAKGGVLAFAADSGKPLWQAQVSSEVLATPVIGDEGVAVRSGDNRIHLLNSSDGSRKWLYQRPMPPLAVRATGSPLFADRYLFAGFPGGKLVAVGVQNGAMVWEGTVAQPKGTTELDRVADIVAAPVVDGTQICAVAFQGRVACFDMGQGGAMIWSRDISSARGLALDGRYLFVTDDQGAVHGLDRLSGGSLWKQDKLKGRNVSAPAVANGLLAVGDGEGYVHFLSRDEGAFVARHKVGSTPVRVPPQAVAGAFLTQTAGGDVRLIEIQ